MHLKTLGFSPKTLLDVGAAIGTSDLYGAFPESHHVMIAPYVRKDVAPEKLRIPGAVGHPNESASIRRV